jgi:hypothetical protein
VCLLSSAGEIVDEWASPPDGDGLRGLAARAARWGPAVRGVIESMNGARFVHDRLEEHGWDVLIADARRDGRRSPGRPRWSARQGGLGSRWVQGVVQEAEFHGALDRLGSGRDAELAVDRDHVALDGVA